MSDTSQSPIEVVRAFMSAMEKKDYDTGVLYIADSCEYINPPPLGSVQGPAGVRAVLEPFFAPVIENIFVIHRESVAGNVVFLERLDRHRLPKGWVELPVTGVFEVHDGKITYWRDYFDLATIMSEWPTAEA
jgi:limonene-1,2-epoxide hydrolase